MGVYNFLASTGDLEQDITRLAIRVVLASAAALVILILVAGLTKNKYDHLRTPLFLLISFVIIAATGTLFGSTIYLNVRSDSGGPVHWHADIEFWACGNQLELRNPSGFLSNKIGTPTLHEHNDQRIHLEGVVVDDTVDASLGKFMRVIGGSVSNQDMNIPIADDILENDIDGDAVNAGGAASIESFINTDAFGKKSFVASSGETCDGQAAEPQTFVYQYDKDAKTYTQKKLEDPSAYIIRDESVVPPGDCIVVEFAPAKERTDKLCEQYGVRDQERCTEFGVKEYTTELCNIKEVMSSGGAN